MPRAWRTSHLDGATQQREVPMANGGALGGSVGRRHAGGIRSHLQQLEPKLGCEEGIEYSLSLEMCLPVKTDCGSPLHEYHAGIKELSEKLDSQTIRTIAKLHDRLGHPSARCLAKELRRRNCQRCG